MGWRTAEFIIQQLYLFLKKKQSSIHWVCVMGKMSSLYSFSLGTENRSRQEPCQCVGWKDEHYWTQWKYILRVTFGYSNGGMQHFYFCLLQRHKPLVGLLWGNLQVWVGFSFIWSYVWIFIILLKNKLSVDRTLESIGLVCYKLEEMLQTLLRSVPLQHFVIGKHKKGSWN